MNPDEIDIDNFIKEKIKGLYPRKFAIEPTADFSRRTTEKIYRLERRRCFYVLYGWAIVLALGPLALRQLWLLIRNDYFAAGRLPFGSTIVGVYHLFLSLTGTFLLLAAGILASLLFVFKLRRGELNLSAKSPKIA